MAKFNNVLVTGYRQQQEQEKKQNELKSKHHIDDPNVVVVEKSNMAKFTVKTVTTALKYSLQGTTQGRYLTGGVPPVRFSM